MPASFSIFDCSLTNISSSSLILEQYKRFSLQNITTSKITANKHHSSSGWRRQFATIINLIEDWSVYEKPAKLNTAIQYDTIWFIYKLIFLASKSRGAGLVYQTWPQNKKFKERNYKTKKPMSSDSSPWTPVPWEVVHSWEQCMKEKIYGTNGL